MTPPPVVGAPRLGGSHDLLPRGTLEIAEPRELLAMRKIHGAYEPDGRIAKDTLHATGERTLMPALAVGTVPEQLADRKVVEVVDDDVVWAGALGSKYGHFLTECVARLWPTLTGAELEGVPVLFTEPSRRAFSQEWLRAFGVPTPELPEHGVVRFTRMHVPEVAWRIGAWIAPEVRDIHLHARRNLNLPETPQRDVVWLSRSELEDERAPYDEHLLEWILREHVAVVHPESLTLVEQIAALEAARGVVGVVGSAFHTMLMTVNTPDCLYLCPPFDKGAYPAQHWLLDANATFVHALDIATRKRRRREEGFSFPGPYRLLIPKILRALNASLLPALFDNERIAAFAEPRPILEGRGRPAGDELDLAVARALLYPLSTEARATLGKSFEARGLESCAREQLRLAADLAEET